MEWDLNPRNKRSMKSSPCLQKTKSSQLANIARQWVYPNQETDMERLFDKKPTSESGLSESQGSVQYREGAQ